MSSSVAYFVTLPNITDTISLKMDSNGLNISDSSEGSVLLKCNSNIIPSKTIKKTWSRSVDQITNEKIIFSNRKSQSYGGQNIGHLSISKNDIISTKNELHKTFSNQVGVKRLSLQNTPLSSHIFSNQTYCPSSPKLYSCFKPRSLSIDSSETMFYSVASLTNDVDLIIEDQEKLEKIKEGSVVPIVTKKISGKGGEAIVKRSLNDKKKKTSWYNVLGSTYKSRREEFKKLFKLPFTEKFIVDYSCALQKDILVQGRLYVCQTNICFYANIFRWETMLIIPISDIVKLTKEKTALVIPNAIQITTKSEKYFFASFSARDKLFILLDVLRRNAASSNTMNDVEFWNWVQFYYGEELGLTTLDVDYNPPTSAQKNLFLANIQAELSQNNSDASLKPIASSPEIANYSDEPREDSVDPPELVGELEILDDLSNQMNCSEKTEEDEFGDESYPLSFTPGFRLENSDEENTSEDESNQEAIEQCLHHEHYPIEVVDEILSIPAEQIFEFCFTDSPLYKQFVINKKTLNAVLPQWSEEVEADGTKIRNISYTLTLNYSIGPKHSPSTEKQIMFPETIPGKFYLIDTECINGGIPYGECFYIVNRYCIVKLSDVKSRLRITSQIIYKKPVWGFVRNFLEKNVTAGIIASFGVLADLLRMESSQQALSRNMQDHPHRKKLLRRRRVTERPIAKSENKFEVVANDSTSIINNNHLTLLHSKKLTSVKLETTSTNCAIDILSRCICFVLIILLIFNAVLYYKLWSLENAAMFIFSAKEIAAKKLYTQNIKGASNLISEWEQILNNDKIHDEEIVHWQNVLTTSVSLLEEMKTSLLQLRQQLLDEKINYESVAAHDDL